MRCRAERLGKRKFVIRGGTGRGPKLVQITRFKRGMWQVLPQGYEPFLVTSEKKARRAACGVLHMRRG